MQKPVDVFTRSFAPSQQVLMHTHRLRFLSHYVIQSEPHLRLLSWRKSTRGRSTIFSVITRFNNLRFCTHMLKPPDELMRVAALAVQVPRVRQQLAQGKGRCHHQVLTHQVIHPYLVAALMVFLGRPTNLEAPQDGNRGSAGTARVPSVPEGGW